MKFIDSIFAFILINGTISGIYAIIFAISGETESFTPWLLGFITTVGLFVFWKVREIQEYHRQRELSKERARAYEIEYQRQQKQREHEGLIEYNKYNDVKDSIKREVNNHFRNRAEQAWNKYYNRKNLSQIFRMKGSSFEELIANIYKRMNNKEVKITPASNDQGVDILITTHDNFRIGIQAKRWKNKVGNRAIQELLGGMEYYDCKKGIIITTSSFTDSANRLANKINKIELYDRNDFIKLYDKYFPPAIPTFDLAQAQSLGLYERKIDKAAIEDIFNKYNINYGKYLNYCQIKGINPSQI